MNGRPNDERGVIHKKLLGIGGSIIRKAAPFAGLIPGVGTAISIGSKLLGGEMVVGAQGHFPATSEHAQAPVLSRPGSWGDKSSSAPSLGVGRARSSPSSPTLGRAPATFTG